MKAVILAAGVSSRLRPHTDSVPKCLLPVAGTPILARALKALEAAGVHDVAIVTGYRERQIRDAVEAWFPQRHVTFISNAAYARTNNCVSMLLAEGFVRGAELLLLDGDLVFDRAAIDSLLRAPHPNCFALRPAHDLGEEEMKAELDASLRVRVLSKELEVHRAAGESVGMFRFTSTRKVYEHLRARVVDRGLVDEWYEAAFQAAIDDGLELYAVPIGGAYVSEIDTPEDLARVDAELLARSAPAPSARREPFLVAQAWANDRGSLAEAARLGLSRVEGDLMLCFADGSYDGAVMVHPGPHLPRRTPDGHLAHSVAEVREIVRRTSGWDAPRLEDLLLELERLDLSAFVESKVPGTFARVRHLLAPHARRLKLISFDGDELREATAGGLATGCLMKHRPSPGAIDALRSLYGFSTLLLDGWYVSSSTIAAAHRAGVELLAFDVAEDRRAALFEMGVDGIVGELLLTSSSAAPSASRLDCATPSRLRLPHTRPASSPASPAPEASARSGAPGSAACSPRRSS